MAIKRMTIDGYASLELNRVSFPLTGRVIADLPLADEFTESAPAENGMILAIDYATGEVTLPESTSTMLGLHFSPEKLYDPRLKGLKHFYLTADKANGFSSRGQVFYPRLGLLSVGERFTTNCVSYDDTEFTTNALLVTALEAAATTPLYGYAGTDGSILVSATAPTTEKVALKVTKRTTMPNGDIGVKFAVIVAQ